MANGENTPNPEQIAERGQKLYDEKLKSKLEGSQRGKFVVIEVESGEYVIADSLIDALQEAQKKYPGKLFHTVKVGFAGVFKMGTYTRKGYFYGRISRR